MRIYYFESAADIYDCLQYDNEIQIGDIFVVTSERIVGFLLGSRPITVTKESGVFCKKDPNCSWEQLFVPKSFDYRESIDRAIKEAKELGFELD